jgi:hypothetical protein
MSQLQVISSCTRIPITYIVHLFERLLPNVSVYIIPIHKGGLYYIDLLSKSTEAVDFVNQLKTSMLVYTFKHVTYKISLK